MEIAAEGVDSRLAEPWETLKVERAGKIVTITLNRPEVLNAMNLAMRRELGDVFEAIAPRNDIRCVVVAGAGRAFCAGGDIRDQQGGPEASNDMMRNLSYRWVRALWNLPQVTLASVNGIAAGGGCNLALACDLVIASAQATFAENFLNIGLVPDLSGMFILPRLVGLHRAKELTLLGDPIDAARAAELGLANRVVPAAELAGASRALAERLAERPMRAAMMTKRLLNRSFETSLEAMMEYEQVTQSFMFATADNVDLSNAFLARSKAKARSKG
jgi:enoyl-CoA hydratase/carnithine racemase